MTQYWAAFRSTLDALKVALDIWKRKKDLSKDEEPEELEAALNAAFAAAEQATALLACELDFELCKCTFPGTPMLFVRYDKVGAEIVRCPKCGTEYPPPKQEHNFGSFPTQF